MSAINRAQALVHDAWEQYSYFLATGRHKRP